MEARRRVVTIILSLLVILSAMPSIAFGADREGSSASNPFTIPYENNRAFCNGDYVMNFRGISEIWYKFKAGQNCKVTFYVSGSNDGVIKEIELYDSTATRKLGNFEVVDYEDDYMDFCTSEKVMRENDVYLFRVIVDSSAETFDSYVHGFARKEVYYGDFSDVVLETGSDAPGTGDSGSEGGSVGGQTPGEQNPGGDNTGEPSVDNPGTSGGVDPGAGIGGGVVIIPDDPDPNPGNGESGQEPGDNAGTDNPGTEPGGNLGGGNPGTPGGEEPGNSGVDNPGTSGGDDPGAGIGGGVVLIEDDDSNINPGGGNPGNDNPGQEPGDNPGTEPGDNPGDEVGGGDNSDNGEASGDDNPGTEPGDNNPGTDNPGAGENNDVQDEPEIKKVNATASISTTTYVYDGKAKKPAVKVTAEDGSKPVEGEDYKVTYSNNVAVGKGSVKVTFSGKYSESKPVTCEFTINPKGASVKSLVAAKKAITVKWNKQTAKMNTARITGYEIKLSTSSKFTTGVKTVKVKGYSAASKKVTSLKSGKKYYVKMRTYMTVNGKTYYSAWSGAKSIKTK